MAIHARPTEQKRLPRGWKSRAAHEAEAKGLLSTTKLREKGCPEVIISALPRSEWHHEEFEGEPIRVYYFHENVVREAIAQHKKGQKMERRH